MSISEEDFFETKVFPDLQRALAKVTRFLQGNPFS